VKVLEVSTIPMREVSGLCVGLGPEGQRLLYAVGDKGDGITWAPIIGDPLTLVAGVLREPFPVFLALVSIAKTIRYVVVALVTLQLAG